MSNKKRGFLFIIISVLIFIGTIVLYNHENEVYNELSNNYVDIDSTIVDEKNNDALVALSGSISYDEETLNDSSFQVSVKTPVLKRIVEVFVWTEEDQTENNQTSYVYKKAWKSELIDSSKFHFQERYENPTKLDYETTTYYATNIKVGAFNLSKKEIESLRTTKTLDLSNINKKKLKKGYKVVDNYITNADNLDSPEVGDVRISYQYNKDSNISILAKQDDNNLVAYKTKKGKIVDILLSGNETGENITESFKKDTSLRNTIFIIISLTFGILGFIYTSKE